MSGEIFIKEKPKQSIWEKNILRSSTIDEFHSVNK